MMSQNRQAQKDHIRDDHEAEEVDLLYTINRQQLEILTLLRMNLCPDDEAKMQATINTLSSATAPKTGKSAVPRLNDGSQAAPAATPPKVSGATPRRRR